MTSNLNDLLELMPDAAAIIKNDIVIAANLAANRKFISPDEAPVVLNISEFEAEIDGISFRFAAQLKDGARLFISAFYENDENPFKYLLKSINGYLREELGVSQASLSLLSNKIQADDDIKKYFYILRRSQFKLHRLADNLTDAFDEESGSITNQIIDLAEICVNLISTVRLLIQDPGINISFSKNPDIGRCATMGDPSKIERMLLNIISNSLKYAPDDGCSIKMTLAASEGAYIITVSDYINGSPKDINGGLFNAYAHAKPMDCNSLGLGISAAQHIARQHGGNIIATRHENGTVFSITIPRIELPPQFRDSGEFIIDNSMTRILTGLSEVISWEKFGVPFIEVEG